MKKFLLPGLLLISLLFLSTCIYAQAPTVTWEKFFPGTGEYEAGNYTANEIKQSPFEPGYVLVGSRNMTWKGYGYREVMVMRVDKDGGFIRMNNIFTGTTIDELYVDGEWVTDTVPWDQVAYDMVFTQAEDNRFLLTGFRDTTLFATDSPPGLFLMEVRGDGRVAFDSLYHNDNNDWIMGRCIQPDLDGGYIIAGSIREDNSGPEKIMMIQLKKNEKGKYDNVTQERQSRVNEVGENGYASWVRPFGDGYLVAGSAYRSNFSNDLFIQKVDDDMFPDCNDCWTTFYGDVENDEFADGLLSGDTIYLAGSSKDPDTYRYQIYVVKAASDGTIIWEKTYGGSTTHYGQSIMRTGDGNILVAGNASVGGYSEMVLLKIDAATGDSLWIQSYGTNYKTAGIRDAVPTSEFSYVAAGRASYNTSQDPRVYITKFTNPYEIYHFIERDELNLDIVTTTPTKDVIEVSADHAKFRWLSVTIDSLLHPSVGDLEITLTHGETTVSLVDQCRNSGKNFRRTGFTDVAELSINLWFAPYTAWFLPEESLFPFLFHDPSGEWTLTITDHGTGGVKVTTRVLEGWSLNFLTESSGEVGIPMMETLTNFGLEPIRPNPIYQEALISFQIPEPGQVNLVVYNQLGQLVARLADENYPAGKYSKIWNPGSLAPGPYFIQLEAGGMTSVRKALVTK